MNICKKCDGDGWYVMGDKEYDCTLCDGTGRLKGNEENEEIDSDTDGK